MLGVAILWPAEAQESRMKPTGLQNQTIFDQTEFNLIILQLSTNPANYPFILQIFQNPSHNQKRDRANPPSNAVL